MQQDASQTIRAQLEGGEKLIWSGHPRQGIILRGSDIFLIPFSVLWCGFAIFWEASVASSDKAPPFFLIFGGLFVLIGLYFVFGRFWVDAKQREKTFYGVTDQRVIIVGGILQRRIKSLTLRTLSDVSLSEKSNGVGTITFGPVSPLESLYGGISWPGMSAHFAPRFDAIEKAKHVYDTIREAQRKA